METFSALLALCAGNSPVTGEFPAQRPVTWSFDIFFDLCLNKWLNEQSWGWWFETPSRSLWRHCNEKTGRWNSKLYDTTHKTSLSWERELIISWSWEHSLKRICRRKWRRNHIAYSIVILFCERNVFILKFFHWPFLCSYWWSLIVGYPCGK